MSVDQSLDGSSNGSGGRFNDSVQQIVDRQMREQEALAKVANPADLTQDDITALPGDVMAGLMRDGRLAHLGYGGRHNGRKH